LEDDAQASLLDLGCGRGEFTMRAADRIGTSDITGVEIWDEGIRESKEKGIDIIEQDLNEGLDLDEKFDVIICNQVIEHLWQPQSFLGDIRDALSPRGYAVISTENLASWDNILSLLMGYTPFSVEFDQFHVGNPLSPHNEEPSSEYPPHTRIFTYRGLEESADRSGLSVESMSGDGYLPINRLADIDPRHSRFITVKCRNPR
jgi:SAM-dependent methyltransferase